MKNSRYFCAIIVVSFLFILPCWASDIIISRLHVNYLDNPVALVADPLILGWQLSANGVEVKGKTQSAYQILVASDSLLLQEGKADLWDSGKVSSSRSLQIIYKGRKLQSRQCAYWKVKIWDEKGHETKWSAIANWHIGLQRSTDWKAFWIANREDEAPFEASVTPAPFFRKEFLVNKPIKCARVYICGLGFYELYLNGGKIGEQVLAPALTNYDKREIEHILYPYDDQSHKRVLYNTFDITSELQKGRNALGVLLGNGWYNQRSRTVEGCMWYDTPRLLLQLEVTYADGTNQIIASDKSWKCTTGPLLSDGIFTGEIYDARKELRGWNSQEYDDSEWKNALQVRSPEGKLFPQTAPYDKIVQLIKPKFEGQINDSTYRYSLSKAVSGWAELKVSGNTGDKVKLRFIGEEDMDFGQSDQYILKGGSVECWEPRFTWHVFRQIEIISPQVKLDQNSICVKVVHTDLKETGTFVSSDSILNSIYQKYIHTQKINLHGSISSDCPHRERLAYTGDGQVIIESMLYAFDCTSFFDKWFHDISDAQNHKTGYVPHTAPFGGGGGGPAWGSAYVIMPWAYYCQYGDTMQLSRHYDGMKHWIQYLKTRLDNRGIVVREEPNGWCLGDWCTPVKIELPEAFVNTAYYYHITDIMSQVATVLGRENDSNNFKASLQQIKQDFNDVFFNKEKNTYWEGRQGANVFPLAFGLIPAGRKEAVLEVLLHQIDTLDYHFDTGILATPLLLKVLTDNGRIDVAYRLMTQRSYPSFGYYITDDRYSCLWEDWHGKSSRCHPMFGSVVAWFYNALVGIRLAPVQLGTQQFVIAPQPIGDLTFCKGSYQSLYGLIRSEWRIDNQRTLHLTVEIPVNITATLLIPQGYRVITESGKSINRKSRSLTLNSGTYNFIMRKE